MKYIADYGVCLDQNMLRVELSDLFIQNYFPDQPLYSEAYDTLYDVLLTEGSFVFLDNAHDAKDIPVVEYLGNYYGLVNLKDLGYV